MTVKQMQWRITMSSEEEEEPCKNGGIYTFDSTTRLYHCDCTTDADEKYAGLRCEYVATEYCADEDFFCTNEGSCAEVDGSEEMKCDCLSGWHGSHCEIPNTPQATNGTLIPMHENLPQLEREQPRNQRTESFSVEHRRQPGSIVIVTLVSLACVLIVAFFARVILQRNKRTHDTVAACTSDLQFDEESEELEVTQREVS